MPIIFNMLNVQNIIREVDMVGVPILYLPIAHNWPGARFTVCLYKAFCFCTTFPRTSKGKHRLWCWLLLKCNLSKYLH